MMSAGDCCIQIIFRASTLIKRKSMEAAHSTESSTARGIPITFAATPLLSKNAERAGAKENLRR
jgi:hypothetical protein